MDAILKKNAINYGLVSGLIGILVTVAMYAIDLKLFVNMWIGFSLLAVWIIIGVLLLSKCKKEKGGNLTFKEGFTAYFLSALIGILLSTAFNIFLLNIFDTEARDQITEHLVKFQVEMLEKFGGTAEQIAQAEADTRANAQFSVKGQMFGIVQSLIGSIILGLILAAIFKSKTREDF